MSHCRNGLDFRGFPDLDCPASRFSHRYDARIQKIFLIKSQPNAHIRVSNSGRETQ
jgi:hypothetical protein